MAVGPPSDGKEPCLCPSNVCEAVFVSSGAIVLSGAVVRQEANCGEGPAIAGLSHMERLRLKS